MKYEEKSKSHKFIGTTGFFTIIACSLIVIGAVSWFAIARYNKMNDTNVKDNISSKNSVYDEPFESYDSNDNDIIEQPNVQSEITENTVSDVPYETETVEDAEEVTRSFILPVEGNISKSYSDTALQYSQTFEDMRLHQGIDILCEAGSQIKACGMGIVIAVEESGTLGRFVKIDHGDGLTVCYYGLDGITVDVDDKVSAGTVIGTLGSIPSECVEKSHLHLETFKNSERISPLSALGIE